MLLEVGYGPNEKKKLVESKARGDQSDWDMLQGCNVATGARLAAHSPLLQEPGLSDAYEGRWGTHPAGRPPCLEAQLPHG